MSNAPGELCFSRQLHMSPSFPQQSQVLLEEHTAFCSMVQDKFFRACQDY